MPNVPSVAASRRIHPTTRDAARTSLGKPRGVFAPALHFHTMPTVRARDSWELFLAAWSPFEEAPGREDMIRCAHCRRNMKAQDCWIVEPKDELLEVALVECAFGCGKESDLDRVP